MRPLKLIKKLFKKQPYAPEKLLRYYYRGENEFLQRYEKTRILSGSTDNFHKQNRFLTLYQLAQHVARSQIPGNFAECGCWRGHSTYLIAELLQEHGWKETFWVFDSFEGGLSDKTETDRTAAGDTTPEKTARQKAEFSSDFNAVSRLLSPFEFMSIHKGWIPEVFETADGLSERSFAFVHIDVDLYEPTRDSLKYFLPRMTKGGVIVVDDYGYSNFPGATAAVTEVLAERTPHPLLIEGHLGGCAIIL